MGVVYEAHLERRTADRRHERDDKAGGGEVEDVETQGGQDGEDQKELLLRHADRREVAGQPILANEVRDADGGEWPSLRPRVLTRKDAVAEVVEEADQGAGNAEQGRDPNSCRHETELYWVHVLQHVVVAVEGVETRPQESSAHRHFRDIG